MSLEIAINNITDCQKELTQALVDGVEDFLTYQRLVGELNGLEKAKRLIHETLEDSDGSGKLEDTD